MGPYSHAVRSAGMLFVSGQPGVDPSTGEAAGFRNFDTVLRAGGSRLDLVVNTTVLVADISCFPELNELFAEFFPDHCCPKHDRPLLRLAESKGVEGGAAGISDRGPLFSLAVACPNQASPRFNCGESGNIGGVPNGLSSHALRSR